MVTYKCPNCKDIREKDKKLKMIFCKRCNVKMKEFPFEYLKGGKNK